MPRAPEILAVVVTGSIAAVKTFLLEDALRARGFDPRFIVTQAAWPFLRPDGKYGAPPERIEKLRGGNTREILSSCKAILIAPASADFIRQIARGDTELGALVKNAKKPVFIAPAMNIMMWNHPAVQDNVKRARESGMLFLGPVSGGMACGDWGYGRMAEPHDIADGILRGKDTMAAEALVARPKLPATTSRPCRKILLVIAAVPLRHPGEGRGLAARDSAHMTHISPVSGGQTPAFAGVEQLVQAGYDVQCAVPPGTDAQDLQTFTRHPVVSDHYQLYPKDGMEHIWLPEDSSAVVISPLSKTYAAEMARGAAESFIGCIYLATKRPVIIVPDADCAKEDIAALSAHGAVITDETGVLSAIKTLERDEPSGFEGKSILVLAGNAREPVDSFRFYANTARDEAHGARVAQELESRGSRVTLLHTEGNAVSLLHRARLLEQDFDAVVQLAGVSQFTCPVPVMHKISKTGDERARLFQVAGNIDLLADLRKIFGEAKVCGYDNLQHWNDGPASPLKPKITFLVRRVLTTSPALAGEGRGEGELFSTQSPSPSPASAGEGVPRVLITAGPTREKITQDGVVITNGSTGRQSREIARAFADKGADVTLVSGPVDGADLPGVRTVHVVSMKEMQAAVLAAASTPVDVFVGAAAIADFSAASPLSLHLKPGETLTLEMTENPSIVAAMVKHTTRPKTVVSFAAQSADTLLDYAVKKFETSGADLTVANPIGAGAATTRDPARNEIVFIYRRAGEVVTEKRAEMGKDEAAREIVEKILEL